MPLRSAAGLRQLAVGDGRATASRFAIWHVTAGRTLPLGACRGRATARRSNGSPSHATLRCDACVAPRHDLLRIASRAGAPRWLGAIAAAPATPRPSRTPKSASTRRAPARRRWSRKGNWVIVPIPVANPTIGNGLQLAALYLHAKRPGEEDVARRHVRAGRDGHRRGTRVLGGFHDDSFANDRFRLNAFVGSGQVQPEVLRHRRELAARRQSAALRDGRRRSPRCAAAVRIAGTEHCTPA